jgi:hypothetical protein
MTIQVQGQTSPALNETIEKRLEAALGQHEQWIDKVTVRLWDENGPKGGDDKRCKLDIDLRGSESVQILEEGSDPYVVVSDAAERAKQAVGRRVAKLRERQNDTAKR